MSDLDYQKLHDGLIEDLQRNIPQEWEASEGSAESIVVDYVRELERRVMALGGDLGAYDGITNARARFNAAAAKHVTTDDVDDWNDMVEAWDAYQRTVEAER